MMLPPEAIEEFKVLYKKHYGQDISNQEASDRANRLVNLFKVVYRNIPSQEAEQRQNKAFDVLFDETAKKKQ